MNLIYFLTSSAVKPGNGPIWKAKSIKAVDTTGAGDAFNGGLAYALSQNKSIKDSLNLANQVAGLSTLKLGAGNAMPYLKDLTNVMKWKNSYLYF